MGAGIFAYPTIADQWNSLHQSRAIATYPEAVGDMNAEDYEAAWQAAEEYNRSIQENTFNTMHFLRKRKICVIQSTGIC